MKRIALTFFLFLMVIFGYGQFGTPDNDDCSDAIELTVNESCSFSTYDNSNATDSGEDDPSCGNYHPNMSSHGDVWFKVTIPYNGPVTFDTKDVDFTDGAMAIYTGADCNNLTEIECDDDGSDNASMPMIKRSFSSGDVVWIRFWEYGGDKEGDFQICVWQLEPPANDLPCGAIELTVNESCSFSTYDNSNATDSGEPDPGCANYYGDNGGYGDVWFKITVPYDGFVTFDTDDIDFTDSGMAIYSGSDCNNLTKIECDDDDSDNGYMSMIQKSFDEGDVIWIRIWERGGNDQGEFKICVWEPVPPSNDSPCGAIELTVGDAAVSSTNLGSSNSGVTTPDCANYDESGTVFDVWYYSIVPDNGVMTIETSEASSTPKVTDTGLEVYHGSCSDLCDIECDDYDGSGSYSKIDLTGLYPGDTIWIRIWDDGCNDGGNFKVATSTNSDPDLEASDNGDCVKAETICGDESITSNATGKGNLNELNCSNHGTLIGNEHYSTWLLFASQVDCEICFTISSADNTDYDFAIWSGIQCNPKNQPIRSSYADDSNYSGTDTGLKSTSTDVWEEEDDDNEGNASDGFVKCLQASAGDEYTMVIDNYSGNGNEFTLTWDLCQDDALDCSTLPVEFVSLRYDCSSQQLLWQTISEINNDYFTIKVGSKYNHTLQVEHEYIVKGKNNKNIKSYYDLDLDISDKYVELWQTDLDGKTNILKKIYVSCSSISRNKVSLYPNPSNGIVNISGEYENIEVYDILGKKVQIDIEGRQIIGLSSGVYIVKIDEQNPIKLFIE